MLRYAIFETLFLLAFPFAIAAQVLDYKSEEVVRLSDSSEIVLYSDISDHNVYYYLPPSSSIKISRDKEGQAEFLFAKYTTEERSGPQGGLLHFLVEWSTPPEMEADIAARLQSIKPEARLKGVVSFEGRSRFSLVGHSLEKGEPFLITSGAAPIFPGSKAAAALQLDKGEADLLYETIIRGSATGLSLVFEYEALFSAEGLGAELEIDLDQYSANFGQVAQLKGAPPTLDGQDPVFEFLLKNGIVRIAQMGSQEQVALDYAQAVATRYLAALTPENIARMPEKTHRIKVEKTTVTFSKPYTMAANLGSLVKEVRGNLRNFAQVNLNDPFFQHQDISFILDLETEQIFEEYVNYITVNFRKRRDSGHDFQEAVVFDRVSVREQGCLRKITYARAGEDRDAEFEYKVQWSLKGGNLYPEKPEWVKFQGLAVTLPSPVKLVEVIIDANSPEFRDSRLRALVAELKYSLFGKEEEAQVVMRLTGEGDYFTSKKILVDKERQDLKYRFNVLHREKGRVYADWESSDGLYYLMARLPEELAAPSAPLLANRAAASSPDAGSGTGHLLSFNRQGKDRALLIAVGDYDQGQAYKALGNPITDAWAIASELAGSFGFQTEIMENPTRQEIKQKLEAYAENYRTGQYDPEGQLLLFFSGHGDFRQGNGYFLPRDADPSDLEASSLSYAIWRPRIDGMACKHILVVIDACFSGTFDEKIAMRSSGFNRPNEASETEKRYQDHLSRYTRLYLSSGGKEQTPDKSGFAKRLLEGLRLANPSNSFLTAGQLYELHIKNTRPIPLFGEFGKDEAGSSFIFIKTATTDKE